MRIKNILFALLLSVASSPLVLADEYDDALATYNKQDYKAALLLFKNSAQQGNAKAQSFLGFLYDKGEGVPQDYAEAVKWYRLAAQQGSVAGQMKLGLMYFYGQGVPQDHVKAHLWLNLAAASGGVFPGLVRDEVAVKMTPQQIAEAQKLARDCVANKLKGCN